MNFLAHLLLAGSSDASRVGNLLGDFVKGTPQSLIGQYPAEVIEGIKIHRLLDRFTDEHNAFAEARDHLAPSRRRFAGIVVDIFFDHFLSRHWGMFSDQPLSEFIAEIYDVFARRSAWLPPALVPVVSRMRDENWLGSYGTLAGVTLTLQRVSQRSPRLAPLRDAHIDLKANYSAMESAFHRFFPAAQQHAATLVQPP